MPLRRWIAVTLSSLLLSACGAHIVPPPRGAPPPRPATNRSPPRATLPIPPAPTAPANTTPSGPTATSTGLTAGPPVESLPIAPDQAARALAAFRLSCPSLVRRPDTTGLTRPGAWQPACAAAANTADADARAFFARYFETVQVGDGRAFATGYFVPEIAGSRTHQRGFDVPIYGKPRDLVDVDLGQFSDLLKGKRIRGRVQGGTLVPYPDRAAIEAGAIDQIAPVIAWAADPVDVFFLQVQGSGLLRAPDGSVMRIGYDNQNGRDYTGIGALMRQRGLLQAGQASMQGITAWLRSHPDEGRALMQENKSFVFFRELSGPPLGALGLPVTGGVSAAVDPKFIPLGAPFFLSMDRSDATGLWVAQDTGGAIKGANRVDTFWGAGADAATTAGGMSAHGTAFVLLPRGTLGNAAPKAEASDDGASIIP